MLSKAGGSCGSNYHVERGGERGHGAARGVDSVDGRSRDEWETRQKKDRRKRTWMGRAIATRIIGERAKRNSVC